MLNCGESANEQPSPLHHVLGMQLWTPILTHPCSSHRPKKRSRNKLDEVDKMLDFSLKGVATKCSKTVDGDGHFGEHVAYTMHF